MSNPLKQNQRANPEHSTPAGDQIAAQITIVVYASGAMQVGGNIEDKTWALVALEHAADAIKSHHAKKEALIISPHNTDF